uniref:Mid2 domain-containing protein n=1 Tax=Mycena chlorophos TaxID=658473 RepID=A0ABQ0M2V9_MYCCL|nr:predicted protein [Mycena chlorophos]
MQGLPTRPILLPATTTMRAALVLLSVLALVRAQSGAVSVDGLTSIPNPDTASSAVHVDGLSSVPAPETEVTVGVTGDAVSTHPVSSVPLPSATATEEPISPLSLSWITLPTSTLDTPSKSSSNKGKIAGGVVGGLAALIAALGACMFVRLRNRRSTRHWRNRTNGLWQDQEGKADGPVYVGSSTFGQDVKAPIASPTTAAPLFIREPRLQRGGHNRDESMEMQVSPTLDSNRSF